MKTRVLLILAAFLSASVLVSLATVRAQAPAPIVDQVQEDWKLVVATPDQAAVGPQITTCMSPVSDDSSPFVAFDMNYREFPSFTAGGLQIQVWSGQDVLTTSTLGTAQFSTSDEVVTWTQQMTLGGGKITYDIENGQSTTWGRFGQGNGNLSVTYNTTLNDLNLYSPEISASKSGVSWQSNHVTSMTLVQVRYYSGGQLVATDTTPRSITLGN
jgi:hypothetical protein